MVAWSSAPRGLRARTMLMAPPRAPKPKMPPAAPVRISTRSIACRGTAARSGCRKPNMGEGCWHPPPVDQDQGAVRPQAAQVDLGVGLALHIQAGRQGDGVGRASDCGNTGRGCRDRPRRSARPPPHDRVGCRSQAADVDVLALPADHQHLGHRDVLARKRRRVRRLDDEDAGGGAPHGQARALQQALQRHLGREATADRPRPQAGRQSAVEQQLDPPPGGRGRAGRRRGKPCGCRSARLRLRDRRAGHGHGGGGRQRQDHPPRHPRPPVRRISEARAPQRTRIRPALAGRTYDII